MKGSLTPIGPDHWRLRVYIGRRDGRPVQMSKNFRGKRRAAETALAQFVTETADRERPNPETITVAALLDRWLEHLTPSASKYTIRGYRYTIDAALKPAVGDINLRKLTTEQVDRIYRRWLDGGTTAATVRKRHTILAAACHQAVKWGWIRQSPTDNASPPSSTRQLSRVMTPAELQALLVDAEKDDPMLRTAIALAALTGARRGELCGLRWADCDLDRGALTIARSITVVDRQWSAGDTKTHQIRRISIDAIAVGVIRQRMDYQRERAEWDGGGLVPDPWLLSRRADGGLPCYPNGLTHGFRRVADRLKLPYHLHECRHLAASMMLAGGVDARTTASRLGHGNPLLTLRTYAHLVGTADEAAAIVLGALLAAPAIETTETTKPPAEAGGVNSHS